MAANQAGEVSPARICRSLNTEALHRMQLPKLPEEEMDSADAILGPYTMPNHIHVELIQDKIQARRNQLILRGTVKLNGRVFLVMKIGNWSTKGLPPLPIEPCRRCGLKVVGHIFQFYLPRFCPAPRFRSKSVPVATPTHKAASSYIVYSQWIPQDLCLEIKQQEEPLLGTIQTQFFNRHLNTDGMYFLNRRGAAVQPHETIGRATSLYDNSWAFSVIHYLRSSMTTVDHLKALYHGVLRRAFGEGAKEHYQEAVDRCYNPIPDDIHLIVLANTDIYNLLDPNRGPIALIICVSGQITVMDEEILAGGAILFECTRVFSLICPSSSLYLIIHIQPAPMRGFHRVDETREVVPNRDRLGKIEVIFEDHRAQRSRTARGAGARGDTQQVGTKRPAPKSAPSHPPFLLRQRLDIQGQDDGDRIDKLMGEHKPFTDNKFWTTREPVTIKAPPLPAGHDPERYRFAAMRTTPKGYQYGRVERRDSCDSEYSEVPYVVVSHPTQPIGFGVFATENIKVGDPRAAIDYVGTRSTIEHHGKDAEYAITVKEGRRTRLEVANGMEEIEALGLPKLVIPDTTGLPARHGAAQLLNHSHGLAASPNYALTLDAVLVPIRNILRGEELVWDYGDTQEQAGGRLSFLMDRGQAEAVIKRAQVQPVVDSI